MNHVVQAISKIIAKTSFNALVATFIGSRGLGLDLLSLDYAGASVFSASSNTAFLCACCFLSLVLDIAQLYSWVCTLVVHWVLLSCLFLITRLSISPRTCFLIARKPCCSELTLFFMMLHVYVTSLAVKCDMASFSHRKATKELPSIYLCH